jgi:hypothetical protein
VSHARHPASHPDPATVSGEAGGESEIAPSRSDPDVGAASALVGGPLGRRVAGAAGRVARALPVLVLLSAAVLSLGLVQKQHCRAQGWSSPDQFWHACYSDIPVLYGSVGLGNDPRPGLTQVIGGGGLGLPPLSGTLMWLVSAFVPDDGSTAPRQFFDLSAVLLVFLLAVAVAAVVLVKGRRPWDAAHLALSPVLVTAGLISYQLFAVALVAVAVLTLARGRAVAGGVLLGLAVLAAPQFAVVALAAVLLANRLVRAHAAPVVLASSLISWFVLRVVLLPGLTGGIGGAWDSWRQSVPGYGSLWLVPQLLTDSRPDGAGSLSGQILDGLFGWVFRLGGLSGTVTAVLSLVLMAALIAGIVRLTVLDPAGAAEEAWPSEIVTARFGPLALALVAAVLISEKSLPVQASVLLLPLIALAGLHWRDHLIWAVTELTYFVGIWLYIAGETTPSRGLPAPVYLTLLLARLAGIAWIGVQAVRAYRSRAFSTGATPPISPAEPREGTLLAGPSTVP